MVELRPDAATSVGGKCTAARVGGKAMRHNVPDLVPGVVGQVAWLGQSREFPLDEGVGPGKNCVF